MKFFVIGLLLGQMACHFYHVWTVGPPWQWLLKLERRLNMAPR
jgi:hypothetical protein